MVTISEANDTMKIKLRTSKASKMPSKRYESKFVKNIENTNKFLSGSRSQALHPQIVSQKNLDISDTLAASSHNILSRVPDDLQETQPISGLDNQTQQSTKRSHLSNPKSLELTQKIAHNQVTVDPEEKNAKHIKKLYDIYVEPLRAN